MAITIDKDQLIRLQNEKLGSMLMELEIVTRQRDAFYQQVQELQKGPPEPAPREAKPKGAKKRG